VGHAFLVTIEFVGAWLTLEGKNLVTQDGPRLIHGFNNGIAANEITELKQIGALHMRDESKWEENKIMKRRYDLT
jgi:hypothetical protein